MVAYDALKSTLPPGSKNPMEVEEVPAEPNQCGGYPKYELFFSPQHPLCCMNHISKARCQRYGQGTVQQLVDQFHLSTYKNRYSYCPSPYIRPLLYGWFPFSLVDKCLKVERLLVDWWPW